MTLRLAERARLVPGRRAGDSLGVARDLGRSTSLVCFQADALIAGLEPELAFIQGHLQRVVDGLRLACESSITSARDTWKGLRKGEHWGKGLDSDADLPAVLKHGKAWITVGPGKAMNQSITRLDQANDILTHLLFVLRN